MDKKHYFQKAVGNVFKVAKKRVQPYIVFGMEIQLLEEVWFTVRTPDRMIICEVGAPRIAYIG